MCLVKDATAELASLTMSFTRTVLLCFAAFLLPLARGDVDFIKPAAGDIITGTSLVAAWTESGQKPAISTFDAYSLYLCAGGNNATEFVGLHEAYSLSDD